MFTGCSCFFGYFSRSCFYFFCSAFSLFVTFVNCAIFFQFLSGIFRFSLCIFRECFHLFYFGTCLFVTFVNSTVFF